MVKQMEQAEKETHAKKFDELEDCEDFELG